MIDTTLVCGVPVDDVTMSETVDLVEAMVATGRTSGQMFQIATVNVDFVVNALRDPELMEILQRADLCLPDGMPLVWASRAMRRPLRARVAGADLVPALAEQSARTGLSLYFFGAAPGVAERAAELLTLRHPGARIAAQSGPVFSAVEDMEGSALDLIRAADPDVLLVALGNPKQERWIRHFGPLLDVPVLIGVGGSFDFLTGRRRRAPLWMQRAGLEWVARAVQEPARLGPRYVLDAWVLGPRLLRQVWLDRGRRHGSPGLPDITNVGATVDIRVTESFDIQRHGEMRAALSDLSGTQNVNVDLSLPTDLDPTTVMSVVTILRSARRAGVQATISALPDGTALTVRTLLGRSTVAQGT